MENRVRCMMMRMGMCMYMCPAFACVCSRD